MSKLVVSQFVSLDGVMQDPAGNEESGLGPWSFGFDRGDDGDKFKLDELMGSDSLLLGRVTYEGFAEAWPSRDGDFADKFNGMRKYVVSTTLGSADWNNSTLIKENVADEIAQLKQQDGGDILVNGSRTLIQTLMEHGLVDEYRLMVFPIVLGQGDRLFSEGSTRSTLRLADSKPVGSDGVIVLTYVPAPEEKAS
ncbi:MAG: dihydrofolate reductase [Geodermatophilaceae bacterium]|nr:dihydrofolate reductase [Geodermatophilaceae bacterium]